MENIKFANISSNFWVSDGEVDEAGRPRARIIGIALAEARKEGFGVRQNKNLIVFRKTFEAILKIELRKTDNFVKL
jgi:hypothetical protein